MKETKILDYIERKEMEKFIEKFREETLVDVINIDVEPEARMTVRQSKFDGDFYLPKNASIPVNSKNEQLLFLAQINCEELPENNIYPKKGIVQFWVYAGDDDMGFDRENPLSDEKKKIIYYPEIDQPYYSTSEIFDMYRPKVKNSPFIKGSPFAIKFEKQKQFINISDFRFLDMFIEKWNKTYKEREISNLKTDPDAKALGCYFMCNGLPIERCTQIGGYGLFTNSDIRKEERYKDHVHVLLQIDSQTFERYNIMWGISGASRFLITEKQRREKDFSNTFYSWDTL